MSFKPFFFLAPLSLSFLLSCSIATSPSSSSPLVTNGITAAPLASIPLLGMDGGRICSSAVLSSSLVLTAAHCVEGVTFVNHLDAKTRKPLRKALSFQANRLYKGEEDMPHDLALIRFEEGTFSEFMRISTRSLKVGDALKLLGFGHESLQRDSWGDFVEKGAGTFRVGDNVLRAKEPGLLVLRGHLVPQEGLLGKNAGMGGGDSGGPLLNSQGELVGIASTQRLRYDAFNDLSDADSVYVDLQSQEAKSFLKENGILK